jgi:hypothetical protein
VSQTSFVIVATSLDEFEHPEIRSIHGPFASLKEAQDYELDYRLRLDEDEFIELDLAIVELEDERVAAASQS